MSSRPIADKNEFTNPMPDTPENRAWCEEQHRRAPWLLLRDGLCFPHGRPERLIYLVLDPHAKVMFSHSAVIKRHGVQPDPFQHRGLVAPTLDRRGWFLPGWRPVFNRLGEIVGAHR